MPDTAARAGRGFTVPPERWRRSGRAAHELKELRERRPHLARSAARRRTARRPPTVPLEVRSAIQHVLNSAHGLGADVVWMVRGAMSLSNGLAAADASFDGNRYEERITLWRANSSDEAIAKAEAEAEAYAAVIEEAPSEYLGLGQSYALADSATEDGAEVFSLIRDSNLDAERYIDTFFETGDEHLQRQPELRLKTSDW